MNKRRGRMLRARFATLLGCSAMMLGWAQGSFVAADIFQPIDFSMDHNARNQNRGLGEGIGRASEYPEGSVVLGGVPFEIPAGGRNTWDAGVGDDPNPRTIDIPVGLYGVTEIHTLINTSWGQPGPASLASVEIIGSEGAFFQTPLVGDVDIRDWAMSDFTNDINGSTAVNVFLAGSGYHEETRLDKQAIALPTAFQTQTLETIRIVDSGGHGIQRLIMYGITASVIPEPSTLLLAAIGAATLLAAACWRRTRNV